MGEELNPFASPTAGAEKRTARMPARPSLTRLLTVGLILNGLSLPLGVGIDELSDHLRMGGFPVLGEAIEFLGIAPAFWVIVAWPIVSLFAAIYTPLVDRDTNWWRTKTVIAAISFVLWIAGCGGWWLFFQFTEQ